MKLEAMRELLKKSLPTKRFNHSVAVYETALALAKIYDADEKKVAISALLHDIKPVVEKIDKEEAAEIASPAANTPTLPDKAGFVDKVVFYTKAAGAWCAEKVVAGWQIVKEYCGLGYHKVVNLF